MPSSACDWSSDVCSSDRSEEHTSELQSRSDLVCRLLLEKKKKTFGSHPTHGAGTFQRYASCESARRPAPRTAYSSVTCTADVNHAVTEPTLTYCGSRTAA